MEMGEKCELPNELLFFDTFTHENIQESNLDLVQFASPIIIDEIRIIPLGARVVADFTGGDRLGATNPSSFDVTFYINDFTKPTVCTFSDFGRFEYKQNINIQFIPEERKPTDGLLIKGSYQVITLAIYGAQTNVKDLITKEETPSDTPISDQVSGDDHLHHHHHHHDEFAFIEKGFNPTANSNQREKIIKTSSGSKTIVVNNRDQDDNLYYSERTKDSTSVREAGIVSTSVNSRDENVDPRKRRKSRSPFSRHFTINSPHSLSPVRSPQSLKSPMSPQSDISLKYESNLSHARSPLMDHRHHHHHKKSSSSSRSPYSRHRTPPPLPPAHPSLKPSTTSSTIPSIGTSETHFNHSPRSPRSPRYIQSRSTSPWYKNQHNPSHPSSPTSPLSPNPYRKNHSPRKITTPAKTPPEESSSSSSSFNKKRHRRARTPSHSPSSPSTLKRIETENNSSNHSVPILPVNTDLLEEISPEHSLSDWAESISEDENLDDIESTGEVDENLPLSNNLPENSVPDPTTNTSTPINNNSTNDYYIHSPPNHQQQSESQEPEPFESISSEEEYFEEGGNIAESDRLSHYSDYDLFEEVLNPTFDPYNCEFAPMRSLRDPSLTNYQHLRASSVKVNQENEAKRTLILSQLSEMSSLRSSAWVESMETIAKDIELVPLENPEILSVVFNWLQDGLDNDLAIKQTPIPFKVRHIKAGIKLTIALANTDESIVNKLFEHKIPSTLINLYYKPHMTLPLKLLILRAFDAFCDSVIGIEHILREKYVLLNPASGEIPERIDSEESSTTCYQHFLLLLTSKPPSRIAIALEALFSKINFYELLQSFNTLVSKSPADPLILSTHIRKMGSIFASARKLLTQKVRCLPVTCFFEIKEPKCNCYLSIYNWFKHYKLIDNLINLLKATHSDLLTSEINQLINILMTEESFSRFLLSSPCYSKTNQLTTLLITHANHDLYNNHANYAGERLNYLLQSYSLIDSLIDHVQSDSFDLSKGDEDVELCTIFRCLHGLLFTPIGRQCVIQSLSTSNHFQLALLPFLVPNLNNGQSKLHTSIWSEYAVKLCLSMVQFDEENIFHVVRNYGNHLISLSKNNQLPKLASLSEWLKPINCVHNLSYSETTFKELMTLVKNYADGAVKLKENELFQLEPQLITITRILYKLCLPTQKSSSIHLTESKPIEELKYYYATIQVYSYDGLSSLLTLLQKLSQTYLRPSHQSFALVGDQGSLVMAFVKPSVKLVKEILRVLIQARGADFRDTSPIPVMLKVYSLMSLFPRSSFAYSTSRETIQDIVDILMYYTQLSLTPSESDSESLGKGVWTRMIREVLKYTFSLPMTFVHGLSLLSELLPLPLPFQTLSPLSEEEVNKMINIRKLWSAHLLGLSSDLEKLISNFVISSSPTIQQLLRRVCIQISDLSSPASTMMVRSVLEVVLDSLPTEKNAKLSTSLLYVLNLLSYLSTHPPFKMAFIHTMHIGGKLEAKYYTIVNRLLRLLREEGASRPIEVQINHLIFTFLQSLCDSDIYLNSRIPSTPNLQILSNSLPPKESLKLIISMLLRFLRNSLKTLSKSPVSSPRIPSSNSPSPPNISSILPVLKILTLLCSHDFGFAPLKQSIFEEAPSTINLILSRISNLIKTESNKGSHDENNELNLVICGFVDFLKAFLLDNRYRSGKLNYKERASLLSWESKMNELTVDSKKPSSPSSSSSSLIVNEEQPNQQYLEKQLKMESDETCEAKITIENKESEVDGDGDVSMVQMGEKLSEKETFKESTINESTNGSSSQRYGSKSNQHPLLILNEYLQTLDSVNEGEICGMRNVIKSLLNLLSSPNDESSSGGDSTVNIELPVIEPLPLQFSKREVFIVTSNIDQEKLNTNFWLALPTFEDDQHHYSQITNNGQTFAPENHSSTAAHPRSVCDTQLGTREILIATEKRLSFIELCQKCLPSDFNFKKTLETMCKTQVETVDVAKSTAKPLTVVNLPHHQSIRRIGSILSNREPKSFTNVKKSFVAPMRNRGFGRPGAMMHSSRANDPFRSRPPNTSRPPSMHVDDFVALEQSGTNCSTYETPSKRMKLDYTLKIRSSGGTGGSNSGGASGGNNNTISGGNSLHNSSSRSFGGSGPVGSRSSPSYHSIDPYSNRRSLISSSHSHSHQSPLRNNLPSTSRNSLNRYSRDSFSPPVSRSTRSDSTGPSSSSQHWSKSSLNNRRDSRDSRDSRSVRSSNNR